MTRAKDKLERHEKLITLINSDPLHSDEDLAKALDVSTSTIRLDRALLGVPELRKRTRLMAEQAVSRLRSLKQDEFTGELLGLEPNVWALSMLNTTREMAFRHTDRIDDRFIYAQASSLAIAVVAADMVVVNSFRGRYREPAVVGERLVARAKVGVHEGNKYIVSVHSCVGDREIYVGRFIVMAMASDRDAENITEKTQTR